jgi:CRP/FNR family transcriptional regulator, cyclic AMP receptor protein
MDTSEFFASPLLMGLSREQAGSLLESGAVSTVPDGSVMVEEAQDVDSLFIVLSGSVQVYLPESEERVAPVRLAQEGPHFCFGEYALIDGRPASASIRTEGDAVVYRIPHERLWRLIESDKDIGLILYRNLLSTLVERLRAANAELDIFAMGDAISAILARP